MEPSKRTFVLSNEADRKEFRQYCNAVYLWGCEKGGVVEVTKRYRPRSLSQNKYLHLLLSLFASWYGCSLEQSKYDFFKKRYNTDIFVKTRVHNGREVTYVRSSASLDTNEMRLAIERFKNKVLEEYGWPLPDAENRDAIAEAEKEIARYAEYL